MRAHREVAIEVRAACRLRGLGRGFRHCVCLKHREYVLFWASIASERQGEPTPDGSIPSASAPRMCTYAITRGRGHAILVARGFLSRGRTDLRASGERMAKTESAPARVAVRSAPPALAAGTSRAPTL